RPLHSFPTRRSSDLIRGQMVRIGTQNSSPYSAHSVRPTVIFYWVHQHKRRTALWVSNDNRDGRSQMEGLSYRLPKKLLVRSVERSEEHTSELQSRFD